MKLLLTHGYFLFEDSKEQQIMKPYVPLGILYLSSHLRKQGYDVDIYDSTFGSKQELFSIFRSGPPQAVGIYANLLTRSNVLEIVRYAREAGWTVIVGGPEPVNYPEQYLAAGAHVVVAGEGEVSLEGILSAEADPARFSEIPGLLFQSPSGEVARTTAAPLIEDLDTQPWPDRERVDIHRYLDVWRKHHGKGSVAVITARGCPYRCTWCSHSVYGKTHRRRSPAAVVDEIEWLLERYSPEMLWIADDVFTIHHGWLLEYAAEMKRRRLETPFECITRADRLNERVVEALVELRCFRVWIGSESGSQRILDAMQRGVTVEQVRTAVGLCKTNGIETGMFLMWGYDGEEIDDIEATVEHVKRCGPNVCFTTVSYPIKGTPYYDRVAPRLVRLANWEQSTDRDFRIAGRHSRRFYKYADDLLRSETAVERDPAQVLAAREGLYATRHEVEA